jgi:hypothetical protein
MGANVTGDEIRRLSSSSVFDLMGSLMFMSVLLGLLDVDLAPWGGVTSACLWDWPDVSALAEDARIVVPHDDDIVESQIPFPLRISRRPRVQPSELHHCGIPTEVMQLSAFLGSGLSLDDAVTATRNGGAVPPDLTSDAAVAAAVHSVIDAIASQSVLGSTK